MFNFLSAPASTKRLRFTVYVLDRLSHIVTGLGGASTWFLCHSRGINQHDCNTYQLHHLGIRLTYSQFAIDVKRQTYCLQIGNHGGLNVGDVVGVVVGLTL